MRWLRHHDLWFAVFGLPAVVGVLQWLGVFHV